jgi:hypothetical protein
MRLEPLVPARPRRNPRRQRLALALFVAPLLIGAPLVLEGLRNPASIGARWDQWLIFVLLPWMAGAWLWATSARKTGR